MGGFARGRSPLGLIAAMYAVSGGLGLVYEVTFSKYLGYVFGATAYASSAVLVSFMGGLALGSAIAGRLDRWLIRPLLAYGMAELLIGSFCLAVPLTFTRISSFYIAFATAHPDTLGTISIVRSLLAMIVVLVPAAGMGATLPLLARFIEGERTDRGLLARLYALNTFGGAVGSLATAYWILPVLGLARTMQVTASISLAIGATAVVLGWQPRALRPEPEEALAPTLAPDVIPVRDALLVGAASGMLVFASEVVFVHLLALVVGTSVYAFGLMLAIFLVCLSAGTPIATRLSKRYGREALGISLATAGLALAASLVVWDRLPSLFVALGPIVKTWRGRELARGLAAFAALAVPVACMGSTFPLLLRSVRAGRDVGRLTAVNTLGSIVGSIVGGFFVLPRLGSQRTLLVLAAGYLVFALWSTRKSARVIGPSVVAAVAVLAIPKWDLVRLTSGANVYFDEGVVPKGSVDGMWEDVHGGVTTIVRDPETGLRTLLTNGKFEGNDGPEMQDNRGFAHLPVLFAESRNRAMVIGLGTGTSAGAIAAYDFHDIDLVDLSPAIVNAARTTFAGVNHRVLFDSRVHILVEDGRNHLLVDRTRYDVVSIELTSIWFAGAANLYNREFYELVKSRLTEGGVLQQWMQLHHTNKKNLASILKTVRTVFPHVAISVVGHQGNIVASEKPLVVSHEKMNELEQSPKVQEVLGGHRLLDFVRGMLLDEQGIDRFVRDVADENGIEPDELVSTDENLLLEYATPKGNVPTADDIPDTIARFEGYRKSDLLKAHVTR